MSFVAWLSGVRKHTSHSRRPRRATCSLEPLESRLLLNAGELDVVFNSTGMAATSLGAGDDQVHAMVVQPDSKIITVGQSGDGSSEFTLARYDKDGQLDPGFGSGGVVLTASQADQAGLGEYPTADRQCFPGRGNRVKYASRWHCQQRQRRLY
jgi:Domain of unknown function (DUF5122) beta-propeller